METENEAKSLDSLRSSIISLQSLFDDFRSKQDAFCMSYEREAVTIEKQILEQDGISGSAHDNVIYCGYTKLGQSDDAALVILYVL